MQKMFHPIIKWTGSKRSQSYEILKYFPKKIDRYIEPFIGGGSVMRSLLESDIKFNKIICSDINKDLIALWNQIKLFPKKLADEYSDMWNELNKNNDIERKKEYYNFIRDRCNKTHQPKDFLFISRTTVNGLIRYNKKGELNNSFHLTRNGINPKTLYKIMIEWSELINKFNVVFYNNDYQKWHGYHQDFIYCDPPYRATKGIYNGTIDYDKFWDWLKKQECEYAFSFDGKTNNMKDYTVSVPKILYDQHIYINSGNSSFRRIIGKSKDTEVYESLYLKRSI